MKTKMNNKAKPAVCIGAAAILAILAILAASLYFSGRGKSADDIAYKETRVEYGSLTVGITEEAEAGIGTLEINMESLFLQSQPLEVEAVFAAAGQEIKEGDLLYTLTKESVDKARAELSADIADAKAAYEALKTQQEESRAQARQGYDSYVTNGKYAQLVYENELQAYKEAVDESADNVDDRQNAYNEKMLELAEVQKEYDEAKKLLCEAEGAVSENYAGRHENAYYYTVYLNTRDTAQKRYDQLEEELEGMNAELEQILLDIQAAVRTMNQCQRDYEKAKLDLGHTQDIDAYYAGVASEWQSIQTAGLDNELSSAKRRYESAVEKLDAFESRVRDNSIFSEYSGVVMDVPLLAGDMLSGGSRLVTLGDRENVTMEVSISEDDYKAVDKDGTVNIVFTAYPDEVHAGAITEVSDAEYDSSTASVYYTLTVSVQGEAPGLYDGMTGDVTFVTKEIREVCYVDNRAVFRDGLKSYVKVRDENGSIVKKEVVTGFSDGVNVEIASGLLEGDIVLIESKAGERQPQHGG